MSGLKERTSSPFGPFIITEPSLMVTDTPWGTVIGNFPILDMVLTPEIIYNT